MRLILWTVAGEDPGGVGEDPESRRGFPDQGPRRKPEKEGSTSGSGFSLDLPVKIHGSFFVLMCI